MEKKLEKVVTALWELKYRNIAVYDIDDSTISKFLVVGTALNTNDNKKLSSQFAENVGYLDKIDGWHKGEWIILDFEDVVVHLFSIGQREKYNIDKLYKGREIQTDRIINKKKKV